MNKNKESKELHPHLPQDEPSSKNKTTSFLASEVDGQNNPSSNVQTVTPAGISLFNNAKLENNENIDQKQLKRSWRSDEYTEIMEKDHDSKGPNQQIISQKKGTNFTVAAESHDQDKHAMLQPPKRHRQNMLPDSYSKDEISPMKSEEYVPQDSQMEHVAKTAPRANPHSGQDIEFKDSNSAISSTCSSPSQQFESSKDYDFADMECKDGESSVGGEGSGSIGSGNSSTSSYISYQIPPAPPSTPASVSYQNTLTGRDIVMAPPLPSTDFVTTQGSYHYDSRFNPSMTSGVVAGSQDLAATPIPHKKPQRSQNPPSRTGTDQARPQYKGSKPSTRKGASKGAEKNEFNSWNVGPRYELIRILGRGSYGEVAQARDLYREGKQTSGSQNFVAIKRITSAFDQEVDAIRIYREMHILRRLRGHECIIQLLDVIPPESDNLDNFNDLYLVFEYVDTDLYKLIMSPQYLTTEHIRTFLYQMLTGLKYIHSFSVIHRDLKPANILLNEDCSLKICDFGLARIMHREDVSKQKKTMKNAADSSKIGPVASPGLKRQLTKHVVTRWYRAPELILIQPYTSAVDIWSIGCILAELLSMQEGSVPSYEDRVPLFPGGSCYPLSEPESGSAKDSERRDQLSVIFSVIGTPSDADIASIEKANNYIKSLERKPGKSLQSLYPAADANALHLLKQMLQFNPANRCTVDEAIEHEFLRDVRNKELETTAQEALEAPSFLDAPRIDIKELKRRTYEEVMWYQNTKTNKV